MSPTLLGLCFLPFVLRWAGDPERLLQLVLVGAVFEAGAAAEIGGFGLPLATVPTFLLLGHVTMQYLLGMRYPGERVLWLFLPLLLLLAYALGSAALLPDVFAGRIVVWPQKPDPVMPGPELLARSSGNLTQSLYLTANILLAVAAGLFLTRSRVQWRALLKGYLAGGYIAAGFALWQLAARVGGVPFPSDVLHSNPGWTIVEQNLGSVPRIQGSFSEPAALAYYMSGIAFSCLWLCVRGHQVMRPQVLLGLAVVSTCLSTSTTGIATLVVGLPATLLFAAAGGDAPGLRRAVRMLAVMAVCGGVVLAPLVALRPELIDLVQEVIDATLSKGESESYIERGLMNQASWAAFFQSGGLGVGWGSARASSLLPGIAAGGGVFGLAMVAWFGWQVWRQVRWAGMAAPASHPARQVVDGFSAALCGQFVAAVIAAPMITSPIFFLQLGAVMAGAVRIRLEAGAGRRATAPDGCPVARSTGNVSQPS